MRGLVLKHQFQLQMQKQSVLLLQRPVKTLIYSLYTYICGFSIKFINNFIIFISKENRQTLIYLTVHQKTLFNFEIFRGGDFNDFFKVLQEDLILTVTLVIVKSHCNSIAKHLPSENSLMCFFYKTIFLTVIILFLEEELSSKPHFYRLWIDSWS